MKLLFLSQGHKISDHPGWHDSLVRLKEEGFLEDFVNIPYYGFVKEYGWDALCDKIISLCDSEKMDVVYFHYFHTDGKYSIRGCLEDLHKLALDPIIITSVGDAFSDNWMRPDYPKGFKEISTLADITFSTQMGRAADKVISWGSRNVVLSPHSMCQVRFKSNFVDLNTHQFDFDVVFIGSNNGNRLLNPISKYWWGAKEREYLVKKLYKHFGNKLGLFGNGWDFPCSQGPVPFDLQQNTFRRGRIVVGANPYSYMDYYASNRPFFEISSGIPTLELFVPRLNNILRNNDHCYFASDVNDLLKKCDYLLDADPNISYQKAAIAAKYIEEKHTQYHRMKFKLDTVKRYIENGRSLNVSFPFFLPEVDLKDEKKYAIRQNRKN